MFAKAKDATIRPSMADYPAVTQARARLAELQAQLRDLESTIDAEEARLRELRTTAKKARLDDAAERARQGLDWRDDDPDVVDLVKLRGDAEVLERAIALQRQEAERQRQIAARDMARKVLPEHKAIGQRIAAALDQLQAALGEEEALRYWALVEDVITTPDGLPPGWQALAFPAVGNGQDVPAFQRIASWRSDTQAYLNSK